MGAILHPKTTAPGFDGFGFVCVRVVLGNFTP